MLGIRHEITQRLALLDSLTATIRARAGSHFEPAMVQAFDVVLDRMCQTKADGGFREQRQPHGEPLGTAPVSRKGTNTTGSTSRSCN